jgi:GT2 family glycosyltransferase
MIADIKLSIVTVTYGHRKHLLHKLLESIATQGKGIYNLVVVFNGPGDRLAIGELQRRVGTEVKVIVNDANRGSAAGFSQGIKAAVSSGASHILLIDDDNVFLGNALEKLLDVLVKGSEKNIFCLNRITREKYIKGPKGRSGSIRKTNRFLGVGIDMAKDVSLPTDKAIKSLPYSGLLIPASIVALVGYPDEVFFLYQDDRDYTYRIFLAGYSFYVVTEAQIADLEDSWPNNNRMSLLDRVLPLILRGNVGEVKIYHSVRSRIIFELKHQVDSIKVYQLNCAIFYCVVLFLACFTPWRFARRRVRLIRDAIDDGLAVGKNRGIPFSATAIGRKEESAN